MYRPPLFFLRMPDNLSHKMNNCRVPLSRRQLRAALLLFVTISLILPIYLDIMVIHLKLLCLFTQIRFSPWMFLHSVSMRLRKSLSECIVRVEWMSQFTTTLLCTWYLLYIYYFSFIFIVLRTYSLQCAMWSYIVLDWLEFFCDLSCSFWQF